MDQYEQSGLMTTTDERRQVAVRFFLFFQGEDEERLANLLALSRRQIIRLKKGESLPQKETAARMSILLQDARDHGLSTKVERLERAERLRAQHEEWQKATRVVIVDGLEEKEIPSWYANVRLLLEKEEWKHAGERMLERHDDGGDWERVPEKTKAYILSDLAVCHHKTGRFVQAADFARAALRSRLARVPSAPSNVERASLDRFLATVNSNLGCSLMQFGHFGEARTLFRQSIEYKRDHGPAYYNDVCAASLARDEAVTTLKLGELTNAASAFLSADAIEEIIHDAMTDKDLAFARQLAVYDKVMGDLRELAARRRKGELKPPLDVEWRIPPMPMKQTAPVQT